MIHERPTPRGLERKLIMHSSGIALDYGRPAQLAQPRRQKSQILFRSLAQVIRRRTDQVADVFDEEEIQFG
jgi:hypothetical protein